MSDLNNEQKYGAGVNPSFYSDLPADENKEKVFLGTIGAILGALVGAILIVIFSRGGIILSFSGVVMAYLSLLLYTKFAGSLSKKGIIICIIIMIITVYVSEWCVYSYELYKVLIEEYNITFGDAFLAFHSYLDYPDLLKEFIRNILMLYLFTALGAIPKIREFIKKKPSDVSAPFSPESIVGSRPYNGNSNRFNGPNTSFKDTNIAAKANSVQAFDERNTEE